MNPYTTLIFGTRGDLVHKNTFLHLEEGTWRLIIHSITVDDSYIGNIKPALLFSLHCNLVRQIESESSGKLIDTPLHVISHKAGSHHKLYRPCGESNFIVTNVQSEIVFNIKAISGNFIDGRLYGIHMTLVRVG